MTVDGLSRKYIVLFCVTQMIQKKSQGAGFFFYITGDRTDGVRFHIKCVQQDKIMKSLKHISHIS